VTIAASGRGKDRGKRGLINRKEPTNRDGGEGLVRKGEHIERIEEKKGRGVKRER